jgi:hypothetical protein
MNIMGDNVGLVSVNLDNFGVNHCKKGLFSIIMCEITETKDLVIVALPPFSTGLPVSTRF